MTTNPIRVHREPQNQKLRQVIEFGDLGTGVRHVLATDAPVESGGEDSAPSPHDYLAASLGACTAITVQMVAKRKAWPLDDLIINVELSKEGGATQFIRTIEFKGALDAEQKSKLTEIANKCPVHQVLSGKIEIKTQVL